MSAIFVTIILEGNSLSHKPLKISHVAELVSPIRLAVRFSEAPLELKLSIPLELGFP